MVFSVIQEPINPLYESSEIIDTAEASFLCFCLNIDINHFTKHRLKWMNACFLRLLVLTHSITIQVITFNYLKSYNFRGRGHLQRSALGPLHTTHIALGQGTYWNQAYLQPMATRHWTGQAWNVCRYISYIIGTSETSSWCQTKTTQEVIYDHPIRHTPILCPRYFEVPPR